MSTLPERQHTVATAVVAWRERVTDTQPRQYLGASEIGHACERRLWLGFRWAGRPSFDGRVLRLFSTGHREEPRVFEELRGIGCEVSEHDDAGNQWGVQAVAGHFRGHMDGAVRGVPEAPDAWHVLEVKTHGAKSFADLAKKGVQASKPVHWAQMQVYMHLTGMDRALYYAVNKDTDDIYCERVKHDPVEAERLLARAERIVCAAEPPPRISADPAWFECKWCHFHPQCHGQDAPEVHCRTCAHSTPRTDVDGGIWHCEHLRIDLDNDTQRVGCAGHRYIPLLIERIGEKLSASPEPDGNAAVQYRTPEGLPFVNGAPPAFSSAEIRSAKHKEMLGDERVREAKATWPTARVVA